MERRNELLARVYLIFFVFVLSSVLIIYKVVKTTVVEGEKWRALGGKNIKMVDVEGERGNIYCSNGNLLATSLPYFDIKVDLLTSKDADFNRNIGVLSKRLSQHFGDSATNWQSKLVTARGLGKAGKQTNARYFPLLNSIRKDQLDLLKSFPLFNLGSYKGGLISERKTKRERPYQELAKRTIGIHRANADMVGLEREFDSFLKGEVEKRLMRRLRGDIWVPVLDPAEMMQEKGSDIVTTLDMHIQDMVHSELEATLSEHKADKGTAVVMDVNTGAIKAMVNLRKNTAGTYEESYNDAVGTLSEPGSTFKLISSMAMLESGKIDLDTEIPLFGGRKKFYDLTMSDSEIHGIKESTFKEAFAISSNVGIGYSAYNIFGKGMEGWKAFHKILMDMGIDKQTDISIYGENKPRIKDPSKRKKDNPLNWSGTTVPWMAHGYELEMTPLQILNYYNAVANDGKLMRPYLVSEVLDRNGKSQKFRPKVLKQNIASPSTILKAQELLKAVAKSGTARKLKVDGLSFAGKTGTTKLEYWKETDRDKYNASFAGYFPAESPKYSMIVVVYNPEGKDFYGAKVAGPVFQNVMKRITGYEKTRAPKSESSKPSYVNKNSGNKSDYKRVLEYAGVEYKDRGRGSWVEMKSNSEVMQLDPQRINKNVVPDVRGKGLRDALYILEAMGLQVDIEGMGKVYKQSLRPGESLEKNYIKIYLG